MPMPLRSGLVITPSSSFFSLEERSGLTSHYDHAYATARTPWVCGHPCLSFFLICFKEGGRLSAPYAHDNVRALEVRGHTALIPAVF